MLLRTKNISSVLKMCVFTHKNVLGVKRLPQESLGISGSFWEHWDKKGGLAEHPCVILHTRYSNLCRISKNLDSGLC